MDRGVWRRIVVRATRRASNEKLAAHRGKCHNRPLTSEYSPAASNATPPAPADKRRRQLKSHRYWLQPEAAVDPAVWIEPFFSQKLMGRRPVTKSLSENRLGAGDSPILLRGLRKIGTAPGGSRTGSQSLLLRRGGHGLAAAVMLAAMLLAAPAEICRAERPIDFNREIKPLLSNTCFRCHGPDPGERKGGKGDGGERPAARHGRPVPERIWGAMRRWCRGIPKRARWSPASRRPTPTSGCRRPAAARR